MPGPPDAMRYVYVKNGDAVDQVRRFAQGNEHRSGPDAFVGDFLRARVSNPLLVLCRWTQRDRFAAGLVTAESRAGGSVLRRMWAALQIGVAVARFRPNRILCGCVGELLWVVVLVAKLLRVPVVVSRHSGLPERRGAAGIVSRLDEICIKASHAVVCHGPFLADQVKALGVPAARIHEFEVDLRGFGAQNTSPSLPAALESFLAMWPTVFMYVGRMQAGKGVLDLLDAFHAVLQAGSENVGLVYVGGGQDAESLAAKVRELGIEQRVLLLGKVPHTELPAVMRRATAMVAPTRRELIEGRCMVVLESLVLGVPVVAPDFAAFPYAIRNASNGMLYEPGSSTALPEVLIRLLREPNLVQALRQGARDSAAGILSATTSFAVAVDRAFGEAQVGS